MADFGKILGSILIVVGYFAGPWWTVAGVAIMGVSGEMSARKAQQQAQQQARDAYNNSLRDQYVMVRGSVTSSPIIYGRTRVSGNIVYAESTGANKDVLWLVIGLCRHAIDAVESIYLDSNLCTVSGGLGDGSTATVTSAPYVVGSPTDGLDTNGTVSSTPWVLGQIPNGGTLRIVLMQLPGQPWRNPAQRVLVSGTDYNLASQTVTFTAGGIAAYGGTACQASYRWTPAQKTFVQVTPHYGTASQAADAGLIAGSAGGWTSNHRLRGIAYLVVKLQYNRDIFPSGIPNVSVVVRGKQLYDPRTTTTVWSSNPALCVRDFLTASPGFNLAGGAVDDTTIIAAANDCDSNIQITNTPTFQTKYTCDGVIDTGADRASNLDTLVSSMAGAAYYVQGKWKVRSGAAVSQVLTLNENNLSDGAVTITPYVSRRDLFNSAKGKFLDAAHDYLETDFPPWVSSTYVSADGGVQYPLQQSFPMCVDSVRCQRLAKIRVLQSRQLYTIQAYCNLSMYQAAAGDGVTVTLARYGISAQAFRIIDRQLNDKLQVVLTLVQDSASTYAWISGEQITLASSSALILPSAANVATPSVSAITTGDATAITNIDGTVDARIRIDFNACTDNNVIAGGYLEIQYRTTLQADYTTMGRLDPSRTTVYIDGVTATAWYQVKAKYVNAQGVSSPWTYSDIVAAALTTVPASPANFSITEIGAGLRHFYWEMPAPADADVASFELRYVAGASASWGTMNRLDVVPVGKPNALSWMVDETLPAAAGTWSFAICSVRSNGTQSAPTYLTNRTLAYKPGNFVAADVIGQFNDSQIAALAASKITGQLTDAQLSAIAAAKVTGTLNDSQIAALAFTKLTGTIASTQIASDTITAKHLAVTDFTNLVGNGDFSTGDFKNWCRQFGVISVVTAASAPAGCTSAYCAKLIYQPGTAVESSFTGGDISFDADPNLQGGFAVKAGDPFFLQFDVAGPANGHLIEFELVTRKLDGTVNGAGAGAINGGNADGAWHTYSGVGVATYDGRAYPRIGLYGGTNGDTFYVANVICQRRANANLIVDGSISAAKLQAGSILTSKLFVVPDGLCPDPGFTDWAYWTTWLNQGYWYSETDAGGALALGVHRCATLSSSTFTATTVTYMGAALTQFSGVGQIIRLRFRAQNQSNQQGSVAIRFFDANQTMISDVGVLVPVSTGPTDYSVQGTVPTGTCFYAFFIGNSGGAAFSGYINVAQVKAEYAADGQVIVDGAITASKIAAGQIDASKMNVGTLAAITANLGAVTAGSIALGSGKFNLASDGTLSCSGATVAGTVTASAVIANSVTTAGLVANAATFPCSYYVAIWDLACDGTWRTGITCPNIPCDGSNPVLLFFTADLIVPALFDFQIALYRDGTSIYSVDVGVPTSNQAFAISFAETPAAGNHTYSMHAMASNPGQTLRFQALTIVGLHCKR